MRYRAMAALARRRRRRSIRFSLGVMGRYVPARRLVLVPRGHRKEVRSRCGSEWMKRRQIVLGWWRARAAPLPSRAPCSLFTQRRMTTNLHYLLRRSSENPKVLNWALQAQAKLNERLSPTRDRLNFTPVSLAPERPMLGFPFVRIAPARIGPYAIPDPFQDRPSVNAPNAVAVGSTKVRDLFSAHVVAAFLRSVAKAFPDVVLELRDESGQFVMPLGVIIRSGGRLELNADVLNGERVKVLEATGDPQAAAPFLWAEAQALNGQFLSDTTATDCEEVPEVSQLDLDPEVFGQASVGDIARFFVERVIADTAPVAN
ncbi:MAG: hypothetical protein M3020_06795 [Myxococcota bacterium]|nr:hypothetical protein [Myxococcota bacterium]